MAAEIYDVPCSLYTDLMCHILCIKSRKNAFVECFCKRSSNVRAARGRILVCKVNCMICNVVTEWRDVGHSKQSDLQLTQEPIQTYKQCHVRVRTGLGLSSAVSGVDCKGKVGNINELKEQDSREALLSAPR